MTREKVPDNNANSYDVKSIAGQEMTVQCAIHCRGRSWDHGPRPSNSLGNLACPARPDINLRWSIWILYDGYFFLNDPASHLCVLYLQSTGIKPAQHAPIPPSEDQTAFRLQSAGHCLTWALHRSFHQSSTKLRRLLFSGNYNRYCPEVANADQTAE